MRILSDPARIPRWLRDPYGAFARSDGACASEPSEAHVDPALVSQPLRCVSFVLMVTEPTRPNRAKPLRTLPDPERIPRWFLDPCGAFLRSDEAYASKPTETRADPAGSCADPALVLRLLWCDLQFLT